MKRTGPPQRKTRLSQGCGHKRYPDALSAQIAAGLARTPRRIQFHEACGGYHNMPLSSLRAVGTEGKPCGQGKPAPKESGQKARKSTSPDGKTRALVLQRDGFACVCCGVSVIGKRYSLQHRKRRSQGGTNAPSNLVVVLGSGTEGCHERIDSRRDPHDEAKGYTVRSHDDPAQVPVMYFSPDGSGVSMYLDDEGGISPDAPMGSAR